MNYKKIHQSECLGCLRTDPNFKFPFWIRLESRVNICFCGAMFRFRRSVRLDRRPTLRAATRRAPRPWRSPPPPSTTWTRRATTARPATSSRTSRPATFATWTALAWWRCRRCRRCRRPTRPATRTVCTNRGSSRIWTFRPPPQQQPRPPPPSTTSPTKSETTVSACAALYLGVCCLLAFLVACETLPWVIYIRCIYKLTPVLCTVDLFLFTLFEFQFLTSRHFSLRGFVETEFCFKNYHNREGIFFLLLGWKIVLSFSYVCPYFI